MKLMKNGWKTPLLLMLCACLCVLLYGAALASGVETDEDGGIWDYGKGTYTDPNGKVHTITPGGVQEDNNSPGSVTVQNDDGSMTVVTNDEDPVKKNEDGSITVGIRPDPDRCGGRTDPRSPHRGGMERAAAKRCGP